VNQETKRKSAQILDLAVQRRMEKQVVNVEAERALFVVFHLLRDPLPQTTAREVYGLPALSVESIVPLVKITYVPGTPSWIRGVVNVRGEIESVLDLRAVLGLGRAEVGPESRLLIAQERELRSGLLVDQVVDITEIPVAAISAPPMPQEGGKGIYVAGEAEYAGTPLLILDLGEIFRQALENERV
jgi:purine-binding chemotaxis protein CheW